MGKYDEALEMHAKSLEIMTRINGDSHRDVAASYGNMGVALMKMAKYEEALVMYSKSLEIDIRVHGDSHPNVAATYQNLAALYQRQGKPITDKRDSH